MDEDDINFEELKSRETFLLDITICNLLDYNGFLKRFHNEPHYFEVCIGVIDFEEFYQGGPTFMKEL
jgi:hypothetical protein